jgi:cell wall-associated NlpC family hydrolase
MNTSIAAAFGLTPLHDPTGILLDHPRLIDSTTIDAQVAVAMAPLKLEPDQRSETQTFVLRGEPLQILGEYQEWQLAVSVIDGYLGWLDQGAIAQQLQEPTHRLKVPLSHSFSAPDLKSPPAGTLSMGSYIHVTGSAQNGFMPLEGGGWVFEGHLAVIGAYVEDPLTVAESFIGAPYLWGGRSALGIDCSGLVQMALASCGHRVHRDSGPQLASLGRNLDPSEMPMRGDLAFFPGHVGWMLDSTHLLHANATNMAVTIDPVDDVTNWVAAETDKPPFSGFKRI